MDQPTKPSTFTPGVSPILVWAALVTLYFVWGSTYLGIAVAVETIPPFLMAAIRFAIAGALLLGWSIAREGRSFRWPTRREWRDSFVVGSMLLGGGMGMVAFGEQTIPSGIAALLIALMPAWVAILGWALYRERVPRIAVVGIVVGFAGVAILVGPTALGQPGALEPFGLAAVLLSPVLWCAGSLFASHRASLPPQPLVASAAEMLAGGVTLTIMGVLAGELARFQPAAVSGESLLALGYLIAIGSLVGFTSYAWLLSVAPLPLISTYAYVNPVVALILGWAVLGEPIGPRVLVAGAIIVVAVALIVTARGRMHAPRQAGQPARAGERVDLAAEPAEVG